MQIICPELSIKREQVHSSVMHRFVVLLFFMFVLSSATEDDCVNILVCPMAMKHVNNKKLTSEEKQNILRDAQCGVDGIMPKVRCDTIPSPSDDCIPITECHDVVRNWFKVETFTLISSLRCGNQGDQVMIKCNSFTKSTRASPRSARLLETPACITPNGMKGECVEIAGCPRLYEKSRNDYKYKSFIEKSACDGANSTKVCCGDDDGFDSECGVSPNMAMPHRIFGGLFNTLSEFPWLVSLKYTTNSYQCGGTLINTKFVLTAAYCLQPELYGVRVGSFINDENSTDHIDARVLNVKRPTPAYNSQYDIGLIQIEKVPYRENIRWACLPKGNLPDTLILGGYGMNNIDSSAFLLQSKMNLTVYDARECMPPHLRYSYQNRQYHVNHVICAAAGQENSCTADIGNPLMAKQNSSTWHIYGIVSKINANCTLGTPRTFTRVDYFMNWIHASMMEIL